MNIKRDNWTNDEVIKILELCRFPKLPQDDGQEAGGDSLDLDYAIQTFYEMKADPKTCHSAKGLNLDNGLTVCVGPRLPQ